MQGLFLSSPRQLEDGSRRKGGTKGTRWAKKGTKNKKEENKLHKKKSKRKKKPEGEKKEKKREEKRKKKKGGSELSISSLEERKGAFAEKFHIVNNFFFLPHVHRPPSRFRRPCNKSILYYQYITLHIHMNNSPSWGLPSRGWNNLSFSQSINEWINHAAFSACLSVCLS